MPRFLTACTRPSRAARQVCPRRTTKSPRFFTIPASDGGRYNHVKIVVTVKLVPDPNAEKRIDAQTKRLVRTGVETVLNPYDEYALEAALQLKERAGGDARVTVFSMAPESLKETLRKALAMGADDAVVLADPGLEGSDVWATRVRDRRSVAQARLRSARRRRPDRRQQHGGRAGSPRRAPRSAVRHQRAQGRAHRRQAWKSNARPTSATKPYAHRCRRS